MTAHATTAQPVDDPLTHAIAVELECQQLRADNAKLTRDAQQAQKARDKARQEATQLRERNERLSDKLKQAQRDAKQAKHLAQQELQQQAARHKPKRRQANLSPYAPNEGDHPSRRSEDGELIVQLAYNQIHVTQPAQHYMVSSWPLTDTENHRLQFSCLFNAIRESSYGAFAESAAQELATLWRTDNDCRRVEDLGIPKKLETLLIEQQLVLVSEIAAALDDGRLAGMKGVGPAAIKQITVALGKEA